MASSATAADAAAIASIWLSEGEAVASRAHDALRVGRNQSLSLCEMVMFSDHVRKACRSLILDGKVPTPGISLSEKLGFVGYRFFEDGGTWVWMKGSEVSDKASDSFEQAVQAADHHFKTGEGVLSNAGSSLYDWLNDISSIAHTHWAWVDRMGWHGNEPLSYVGLIASEVGEAVEALDQEGLYSEAFQKELSDIVLRALDLAVSQKASLRSLKPEVALWVKACPARESVCSDLAGLMPIIGRLANAFRSEDGDFNTPLRNLIVATAVIARRNGIDLEDVIVKKIHENRLRGTRGRRC